MTRFFKLTLCLILISGYCSAQQYPVFTQYFFNELVINPAYAGAHVQFSATAIYRNQWVNFPGAPRTFSFSAHTGLAKNKVGVGLLVNHDEIGSYGNDHIYASYSYKLHFNDATLSMGLQAGVNVLGADYSKLNLKDPLDMDASFAPINDFKPNFGAGLYFNKKNWFVGLSVPFILNNKLDDSGFESALAQVVEKRYYMLRSGIIFPINRMGTVKMNPSILLRSQEGQPLSLDINNAFIFYDIFSIGTAWRSGDQFGDSFITFLDLKLTEKLHFAYSYDWTMSDINKISSGSHEFMINFRTPIRGVHKNPECPQYYDYR
jgi:type IX secretion system PorP/SprF family membrane protein